jgi:hypothetical protein
MSRAALMLAVLATGCAAGCAAGVPFHRAPTPGPETGSWAQLRDEASRRATLYDGFSHLANASATWLSPAVREAQLRRRAEWQGRNAAELEQALATGRADAALGEEFLVAFYTAERRVNDLDAKRTVWHLELDDGTVRVPAFEVVGVSTDATLRQLYPFVDPFQQVYRVRFAWTGPPLEGRPFTVRIAGALGELVLDFGPEGQRTVPTRLIP